MEDQGDLKLIEDYDTGTQSHWAFLVILFISYFFADQVYIIIENYFENVLDSIDGFTGDYTYAVFISVLILALMKTSSKVIPELNIDSKPQNYVWIIAILILSHPIRFYQTEKTVNVNFELFGFAERSLNGSNELFIFLISALILIFAVFGGTQILLITDSKRITESKKFVEMISVDFLPALGIIFSVLYLVQSYVLSKSQEIDFSQPVKFIFYIIFAYASVPNILNPEEDKINHKKS
ncbi:MAG: hypothetical protein HeimC2_43320 [Candidatus Heimdallarchaeota archaeon LC_2]|nr:MAG: hypothetical protein HeimC2_43320 [Candidatus Heimdallarchaeota archaeon LC_2]